MKRLISVVLIFALALSLASCKNQKAETPTVEKTIYEKTVEVIGSPEAEPISQNPFCTILRVKETGVQVRYIEIEGVSDGEQVNIMQLTDVHLNALNERDKAENNPSVMSSYENREYCRDGASLPKTQKVLEYAKYFDAVVATGDNIDYLTWGSLELLKENLFDKFDNLLVCLGNHEATRQMTGTVPDTTSLESRLEILREYWKHDLHYTSLIIKDRVMLIQLDNSRGKYLSGQAEKLEADINKAREKGLTVLIFQHIPLSTRNPSDSYILPMVLGNSVSGENFYSEQIGAAGAKLDDATEKVYNLITTNADVVRGVFCGHLHYDFQVEINASYKKNGETVKAVIPQVVLNQGFNTNGHFLSIVVK